jgi:hypothetical protein
MRVSTYLKCSLFLGAVFVCLSAAPASATVLCYSGESTSSCSEPYEAGTEINMSLASGTKTKLKTEVQTVECSKSTLSATSENGGSETETVKAPVGALTFEECNCEVKTLKAGTLEVHSISGTTNGTVTETGAEVTVSCNTIFGNVHCLYATENTDLGTLTGGTPASLDLNASIPRLTTSFLCAAKGTWEGTYAVTNPDHLYVTQVAKTNTVLCSAQPTLVGGDLECPAKFRYSGMVLGEGLPGFVNTFKWNEATKEEISCGAGMEVEGKFNVNGTSPAKGGISKFVFESLVGGFCTSNLPKNQDVKIKPLNLNFEGSRFTYISSKPPEGRFSMRKNVGSPELQIEIIEAEPKNNVICKYTLSNQTNGVQNGDENKPEFSYFLLEITWQLKPKEPGACSGSVKQEALGSFGAPGHVQLYIAKK